MATPDQSTPDKSIAGIHHVTAITADAQKNMDFYTGVLGLRLVKLTVNFDDPGSYHLYYGDELGRPGTILTFFAWAGAHRGRIGPPQVTATAMAVPAGAIDYWFKRLKEHKVDLAAAVDRFGERVLGFADPDGLRIEIVGGDHPGGVPWSSGPIPSENAIRGFHGVTIAEEGYENTANHLTEVMGFQAAGDERAIASAIARSGRGFGIAGRPGLRARRPARQHGRGCGASRRVSAPPTMRSRPPGMPGSRGGG